MKYLRLILAFGAGVAVTTSIAVVWSRLSDERTRLNTASDVYHPLGLAIESIEKSASRGDCKRAAAQLRILNQRFDEYWRSGGPTPANWYSDVAEAAPVTEPAH